MLTQGCWKDLRQNKSARCTSWGSGASSCTDFSEWHAHFPLALVSSAEPPTQPRPIRRARESICWGNTRSSKPLFACDHPQEGVGFQPYGLDLSNPDFVKYAEAYGARGYRVTKVISVCLALPLSMAPAPAVKKSLAAFLPAKKRLW